MKWKEIKWLIKNETKREWQQRYALNAILLYAVAAVYIIYLAIRITEKPSWNGIFWVILLFSGITAVAKSFLQESRGRMIYYHQMVHPASYIVAKMIYNSAYLMILNMICLAVYILWMGNMADNLPLFAASILLGSMGFAAVLTMASAISSKTGNGHLIMPILSIPLLIPLFLVAIKSSKKAVDGLQASLIYPDLLILFVFFLLVSVLGYVLFPWLWKE